MPKLLVIDDETYIRMLYKKEFESDGYEVDVAADSAEAVEIIGADCPDAIILDIELGDESGLTLLNRLRQEHPSCAIVLNSAYSTYKSDFQSWLADAYIMKSSDLTALKTRVRSLLMKGTCGKKE